MSPKQAPAEEENLDSAARLMQEALTKAAVELEKTVTILTDQLAAFNQGLERQFQDEMKSAHERLELCLRQSVDSLSQDKEELKKQLSGIQQTEIQSILQAGRQLRSGLSVHLQTALESMTVVISQKIAEIDGLLSLPEADFQAKVDQARQAFEIANKDGLEKLKATGQEEEERLAACAGEYQEKVNAEFEAISNKLESLSQQLDADTRIKCEFLISQLTEQYEKEQKELEKEREKSQLALLEEEDKSTEKLRTTLISSRQYFDQFLQSFSDSLEEMSQRIGSLYEMDLLNVAGQSQAEMIATSLKAEQGLSSIQGELSVCLGQFQRDYIESFELLLKKLERTIEKESKLDWDAGFSWKLKEERAREHLQSLFRRIGNKLVENASAAAAQIEADFQNSVETCEQRIETVKSLACESLERETKLMKKELQRSHADFEKQISDLELQISRIEKVGVDAANIVMTIRKANLRF